MRCGLPPAIAFARDVHLYRTLLEGCAAGAALVPDLVPVLPLWRLCEAQDECGCVGVHVIGDLRTNELRDVGACGHGIAIAQKMSFVRGQVVENQRSVQRTARRDRTTSFVCPCAKKKK